jgi:hypothetical protein
VAIVDDMLTLSTEGDLTSERRRRDDTIPAVG